MGRLSSIPVLGAISRSAIVIGAALIAANCAATTNQSKVDPWYGVTASPRVMADGDEIPKGQGRHRVGNPYVVAGVTYIPEHNPNYRAEGMASWYGDAFHGRLTSNGEIFDMRSITAAHPTLPLPSYVRVTNLANRKSMIVRVNDRGPFHTNRVIDVSSRAADMLGFKQNGVARVRVEYVGPASIQGSDDRQLVATLRHDGQPAPAPSTVMVASAERRLIPQAARPVPESAPTRVPETPQRSYQVAGAGAWSFGPQPQRTANPAPAIPARAAAPAATPVGFNATPPMPASGFSPASVSGRGLY